MDQPQRQYRDWWRILRVFWYLARRPQDLPDYCRFGAFNSKSPLELGVPWWSFGAVKNVEARLKPDWEAFEYGSGGSTLFIGSRTRSIISVEDDIEWTQRVSRAARERGLSGVSVLHKPFDFWMTEAFATSDYLLSLSGKTFDVIVIDGREWSDQVRDTCFWRAEDHVRKGGIIILDDSWRYPQVKHKNRALRLREYKGTGYCRVGVTSTSVFEY